MSLFGIHQELSSIVNEIESLSPEEKGREGDTLSAVRAISTRLPDQDKPICTDETIWLGSDRDDWQGDGATKISQEIAPE